MCPRGRGEEGGGGRGEEGGGGRGEEGGRWKREGEGGKGEKKRKAGERAFCDHSNQVLMVTKVSRRRDLNFKPQSSSW